MTDITELALLISKAKASVFTLEYISQFEPADIDSDDVDLRLEVDGRDTGTNVSIVDECGQAAKVIGALVEALASEKRICATWRKTSEANSEKLEKAQQRIGKLEKKLTDHKRMNQEMAKAMLTPNDSDAAGMEIAALRQRIAGLEREQEQLRPVGVMSEKAFHRLENSECRFIALWPRPGIFLQRKRPEDGVLVYARTAAAAGIKVEAE